MELSKSGPTLNADFLMLVRLAAEVVQKVSGIQLAEKQHSMIQARLVRRMLDLNLDDPQRYAAHIAANQQTEAPILVSLLTTHHTYFFREFEQFTFMQQSLLSQIVEKVQASGRDSLRIWSVACSRGQEVYSLSMFLVQIMPKIAPGMKFEIIGTDIDQESIAIAKNGVYRWDEIKEIPAAFLSNHWTRGAGDIAAFVKAKPSIKNHCKFKVDNILTLAPTANPGDHFDLIFCRNVFIYFTDKQVETSSKAMLSRLAPWGSIFVGISESLNGRGLPVRYIGPAAYTHNIDKSMSKEEVVPVIPEKRPPAIRVLCVDDSSTVLMLLNGILSTDHGFKVVGTAKNGLEAAHLSKTLKYDVMTLDIHMPEQNGIDYLGENFGPQHAPVVMISSVSREDSGLGMKALGLGASDYVEKPTVQNLSIRSEEIRTKLRCAVQIRGSGSSHKSALSLVMSFKKNHSFSSVEGLVRVIVCGLSNRKKLVALLANLVLPQPITLVLIECGAVLIDEIRAYLRQDGGINAHSLGETFPNSPGGIYCGSLENSDSVIKSIPSDTTMAVLSLLDISMSGFNRVIQWPNRFLLVEEPDYELTSQDRARQSNADKVVPFQSLLFDADSYLATRAK